MIWSVGQKLKNGLYTIEKLIDHGRLSLTYRAKTKDNKLVVLKVPNDQAIERADFDRLQERFINEAFKLQKCIHPHIVRVFEPFQEDGIWCIPMEYIAGTTLSERDRSRLPEAEAIKYIQQIGEALTVLHGQSLIHRDVNPSNIMIRIRDGVSEAVLIDFGLVRDFTTHTTIAYRAETTADLSPPCRAPELYLKEADRGPYTDVYSLGAVLYDLVTGTAPRNALDRRDEPALLTFPQGVSETVQKAIESAMTLSTMNRPASMAAWLKMLTNPGAAISDSSLDKPGSKATKPFPWKQATGMIAAITGLIAAITGLIAVFQPQPKESPSAIEKNK